MDLIAGTLLELGSERAFVVHGADGLDEISLSGETLVAEVHRGTVRRYTISPEDFGMSTVPLNAILGTTPTENASLIRRVLDNELGPRRDIVVINAAAALLVSGITTDFREAAQLANAAISSGAAQEKLKALSAFTHTS
jgi:anthranilate phosphoribosyltransferase